MNRLLLFLLATGFTFNLYAQNGGQIEVLKFFSDSGDTVLLYANEIKIVDQRSFEVLDYIKSEKLKELQINEVYFVCKYCSDSKVELKNILSSSTPAINLYILVIGKNKIHFHNNSIIECSKSLLQKLQSVKG